MVEVILFSILVVVFLFLLIRFFWILLNLCDDVLILDLDFGKRMFVIGDLFIVFELLFDINLFDSFDIVLLIVFLVVCKIFEDEEE